MSKEQELQLGVRCRIGKKSNGMAMPAVVTMMSIPETFPLFYADYNQRHPLGHYQTSISSVGQKGCKLLDILSALRSDTENHQIRTALTDAEDAFLDACMEHMEDCEKVIRCLFPTDGAKRPEPTDGKSYSKARKSYQKRVSRFRNYIGKIDNHIKHAQGRVCYFQIKHNSLWIPGFFIESMHKEAAGPDPTIHRNRNTAISFAWHLRHFAAEIMNVSQSLALEIAAICDIKPVLNPSETSAEDLFSRFLFRLNQMSTAIFPDECEAPWIFIRTSTRRGNEPRIFKIEVPSSQQRPVTAHRFEATSLYTGDGTTRAFILPYSRKNL